MVKILVVEDEEKLARFIELELTYEGYEVIKADNGRDGLDIAEKGEVDLVLLDVMLPQINGLEVLRRLRKVSEIPVIMLTARDAVMDKVAGLDGGADDYMTKPFAIEELLARIRVTLKKKGVTGKEEKKEIEDKNIIKRGLLSLDKLQHKVTYNDTEIELTNREFVLLQILLENKNIVMTRDVLIEKICGYDYYGETNVIDVYVRFLRVKIDDAFKVKVITTVRGVGYVIKDE
ncbi:MAG: response regulator transcription factor [Sarcina sp.]